MKLAMTETQKNESGIERAGANEMHGKAAWGAVMKQGC